MDTSHRNLLVTCGGKWVGMVLQLREAMERVPSFRGGRIIVASSDAVSPAGCFADASCVVPLIRDPSYVDHLLAICHAHAISAVVPLIDLDLERLAPHRDAFAALGAVVVCPPPDLIELTLDKLRFAHFAAIHSLAHPPTWLAAEIPAAAAPLFYKRRRGFGSIGSGVCASAAEARTLAVDTSDLLFQPLVHASEFSVDAYIARSGRCIVCVPRVREKVVAGEAYKTRTIREVSVTPLARRTIDALAAAGLRGPLNVQIFDTSPPMLIEVNTRLGSASVLANVATGGRLFEALLQEAAGASADGDPDDFIDNLALNRFLGDVFHQGDRIVSIKPAVPPRL